MKSRPGLIIELSDDNGNIGLGEFGVTSLQTVHHINLNYLKIFLQINY